MKPSPLTVRLTRTAARLSQKQAAALVGVASGTWSQYEREPGKGSRSMPAPVWELFTLKLGTNARIIEGE